MSLPNPNKPVTEERLAQFYQGIYPYLGGQVGGDVPIGSIISLMGTTVPYGYLACNGQTVSISEYTALANFFETEFGSKNYFGGDGTTTIGVPDLRGEFLRGTGTNSHTNQGSGGTKAGDHQDATDINSEINYAHAVGIHNYDSAKSTTLSYAQFENSASATRNVCTVRPTNTSVLYCIKAKPGITSGGGGGSSITVDDAISDVSTNPVQNKVISVALDLKADASALAAKADASALATKADVSDLATKADLVSGKVPNSQLPDMLSLGESSTTAYAGDKGKANADHIGNLASLTTTVKTDLVAAVNEVKDDVSDVTETITYNAFDQLSQAEKDNGTAYYIPDAEMITNFTVLGNRFDKANIYTEDERMIGSWLGKPLYQKTIDLGAIPSGAVNQVMYTFDSEVAIPFLVRAVTTSGANIPLLVISAMDYSIALFLNDLKQLKLSTRVDCSGYGNILATVQYTKTSDGTVSIGTGNDYSTDEQIIGTWIDGKRLYQKTIEFTGNEYSLSSLSFDFIQISCVEIVVDGNTILCGASAYFNDNDWYRTAIVNNTLLVQCGPGLGTLTKTICTFQYTKTTD